MQAELSPDFFARHSVIVARELLGMYLLTADCGGMIVEAEAYRQQDDPACHSFGGRQTRRNASMFLSPGHLYVYRIHQVFCLNLTTEAAGLGCAVLIRALEPSAGIEAMLARRQVKDPRQLTNGPGKLCQALGIDLSWDSEPLGQHLRVEDRGLRFADSEVAATGRIGISRGQELPWRFVLKS
ncbi:MAG: DNA-3-methyladenine glycosylase [Candidatus Sericytochromatia bacterium]